MRESLALVLDTDDLVEATRLARELAPWFGVVKVGLELYSAAGPDAVETMRDLGYDVFVDLKLRHPDHRATRRFTCSARSAPRTSRCTPVTTPPCCAPAWTGCCRVRQRPGSRSRWRWRSRS
ncbi:MAG: orotidine 5'-phosphate decarboxylase / HUMPS family protein [Acidimicrobiales bacterium]